MTNLPIMQVIICSCHGRVAKSLSLDNIAQFFRELAPGLEVVITDNLCKHNNLPRFNSKVEWEAVIVGACSQIKPKLSVWKKDLGKSTTSVRVVDVLEELAMPYSSAIRVKRIKLLLLAQMRRLHESKQIYQENLKLSFSQNREMVSRREFLISAMPQYEVIPCIEPLKCAGGDKCRVCYDACPFKGIVIQGDLVAITDDICNGCGTCLTQCPQGAIHYPTFSLEEIYSEMEGLLFNENVQLEPRIIAISCQTDLPSDYRITKRRLASSPSILPLKLPSLGMVSPWLLLSAFYMGAQGVAVIPEAGKRRAHLNMPKLQGDIEFVQAVLECWEIERERLRLFKVTDTNVDEVNDAIGRFTRRISNLGSTVLSFTEHTLSPNKELRLTALIEAIDKRLGCQPKSSISEGIVPFGKLELDTNRCTGCGICALSCPTGALNLKVDEDSGEYHLLFHHGSCVACETCLSVCPESCLTLHRILKMDEISHAEPILSDRIVSCQRCGNPVAPELMIESLRSKLQGSGKHLGDQLELCPTCKVDTVRYVEDNLVTVVNKGLADKNQARLGGI